MTFQLGRSIRTAMLWCQCDLSPVWGTHGDGSGTYRGTGGAVTAAVTGAVTGAVGAALG
jgi:hypothetical protein